MKRKNSPVAIVLGMTATGLSVARSLGRKGIEVVGLDSDKRQPGMFSRYLKPYECPNPIGEETALVSYLVDFGKRLHRLATLFCASDEYVAFVSRNRERLQLYFKFNIPSKETVEDFLDKRRSYVVAQKYDLQCPSTYFVENEQELKNIISQIRFPSALKPAVSHLWRVKFGGKKLIPVNSAEELLEKFNKIKKEYSQIMIQELIPGKDDQIYAFSAYFDNKSKPLAFFTKRKFRQHPIHFGVSSFSVSESNERVKTIALEFFKKIKYTGIGALELKRDSRDHEFKFTELNLRFLMTGELAIASGVDLPYIMYRDLIGEKAEKIPSSKEGVKLINLELDLGSFWQYRNAKEITLKEYLKSFKGGKIHHTYFAFDDLMPFIFVLTMFMKTLIKKTLSYVRSALKNNISEFRKHITKVAHPVREAGKWGYSFMPLRVRNRKRFFDELEFLQKSQWWSKEELETYQNEKLRKLIRHAYEYVPYYNGLFRNLKLRPGDIKTIGDLYKIPMLTKETVKQNTSRLIATNFKKRQLKELNTGGTMGEPLHFYVDKTNEYLTGAPIQWRYFGWGGCSPGSIRVAMDCRRLRGHLDGKRRLFQYDPISSCLFLSIGDLLRDNVQIYVDTVERYQPKFFKAYPSALELFIKLLKEKNIKLSVSFKGIFTNSEILYPWQRTLFEEYFGCKVLDWYALQERVLVAAECGERTGYHISAEYGIIEFTNEKNADRNAGHSDIVATGLTNFGMPLIRYRTGDVGSPITGRCRCGRGLPLMKLVGGRERAFFITKSGDELPFTLISLPKYAENVRQFQFIQQEKGKFRLKILRDDKFVLNNLDVIHKGLKEQFGNAMDTEIEFTDSFERTESDKFLNFVQMMKVA